MVLALNNQQWLIYHKTQTTNQPNLISPSADKISNNQNSCSLKENISDDLQKEILSETEKV